LVLTPDKKTLVTGDKNGQVKVWDLSKRTATHTVVANKGENKRDPASVIALAMSPDGKHFASVTKDNVVKLWDVAEGKELRTWDLLAPQQPTKQFVRTIVFTPDGRHVATANADTTVYLLDCP
jgi:WD40 repeat protein